MAEYTPITAEVRAIYIAGTPTHIGLTRPGDEFDRWLAAHDREVAAQAWDEGWEASENEPYSGSLTVTQRGNPYRSGTEAETGD